ncbi:hypothetical protein D3C80_1830680 [compost metagenome]
MNLKTSSLVIMIGLAIALRVIPPVLRKRKIKELLLYSCMLIIGVWISILGADSEQVPSPLLFIEVIYTPVNRMLQYLFPS